MEQKGSGRGQNKEGKVLGRQKGSTNMRMGSTLNQIGKAPPISLTLVKFREQPSNAISTGEWRLMR